MLDFAEELQFRIDNDDYTLPEYKHITKAEPADTRGILNFFTTLEPIDEKWQPYIEHCTGLADKIADIPSEHEPYLRRLAIYFIFRSPVYILIIPPSFSSYTNSEESFGVTSLSATMLVPDD